MTTTLPAEPTLREGDTGRAVLAAGRGYHNLLGKKAENLTTGYFGKGLLHDVLVAEQQHGLKRDQIIGGGGGDWALLAPHIDAYGRWLLAHDDPTERAREQLMRSCDWALAHYRQWRYEEVRPMAESMRDATVMDCSETVTLLYKDAGCPDPNGFGYNGYGDTTSLMAHCPHISFSKRKPGALVFYSNPWHVSICLRDVTRVLSFGSNPLRETSWDYRTPVVVCQPALS